MKKLLIIALLLFPLTLNAQILYRVSGGDLTADSYILGTHHLTSYSFTESIPGFEDAFGSCEALYGEIKLDNQTTQSLTAKMMPLMTMPKDTLFSDLFTQEEYEYIDSQIQKYLGSMFSLKQLSMLRPAAISMQLSAMVAVQDKDGNMNMIADPMDVKIQEVAQQRGLDVDGLESIDSQVALLFGDSLEEQAEALLTALRSGDLRKENETLTALYESQDSEALFKYIKGSIDSVSDTADEAQESIDKLIFNRNNNWADILPDIMRKGSTFIAVGAGHLHGSEGLIQLLEAKGYRVTAVK